MMCVCQLVSSLTAEPFDLGSHNICQIQVMSVRRQLYWQEDTVREGRQRRGISICLKWVSFEELTLELIAEHAKLIPYVTTGGRY